MILYRLAKWMEEQEQEKGKERVASLNIEAQFKNGRTQTKKSKGRNALTSFDEQFPLMKQEVERFQEQVPY